MSLSYQPLEPVLVKDPRVIVDNKRVYAILKCGKETNFKRWTTNSVSTSNINFSTPPPSSGVIIDRKITLTLPMRLEFSITCANQDGVRPIDVGYFAPRAFPIHSMLNTVQLTINNCSITQNIGDIIHALLRYNTFEELLAADYSSTPSTLDTYVDYYSGAGSGDNPLAALKDKSFFGMAPRGGFAYFRVVTNTVNANGVNNYAVGAPLAVVVDMLCTEQIMMSPLYWGKDNASGFTNVVSMDWVFNFYNNCGVRAISLAARQRRGNPGDFVDILTNGIVNIKFNNISGPDFSFAETSQPLLNITYITPDSQYAVSPSTPISYPFFSIDKFVTKCNSSTAYNATGRVTSNNIQLSSIPRRVYVYIRPSNDKLLSDPRISDCYYAIESINVQFGNRTGLFAEASKEKLYEISRKNHCSMSWSEWSGGPAVNDYIIPQTVSNRYNTYDSLIGTVGSVFCFEMASDIGLDPSFAPGVGQGSYNLQVNVSYKNINNSGLWNGAAPPNEFVPELYVVPVYEGTFTITGLGSAMTQTAVISFADVQEAQQNPMYNYKDVQEVNGGNFMSGIRNLVPRLKSANKFLKDNKVISRAADAASYIPGVVGDVARDVSSVASKYGYGLEGGVVLGGAKMTKKQLQNRLKHR